MVINNLWIAEKDYKVYPKKEWCDCDYIASWINDLGYKPKTTIENLVEMIMSYYYGHLQDEDVCFYTDIELSENGLMVSVEDISCFVNDNGGLKEFDYYC